MEYSFDLNELPAWFGISKGVFVKGQNYEVLDM